MATAPTIIAVNGAELAYTALEEGSGKPPLVLLHGYGMRSTAGPYDELLELLAQQHTVYAVDLRGHGASSAVTDDWTIHPLTDDLSGLLSALRVERPVLVGHSFGAVVGLATEIRFPGTFSALCLVAPGPADTRDDPIEALHFLVEHGRNGEILRGAIVHMFTRPTDATVGSVVDAITIMDPAVHLAQTRLNQRTSIDDGLAGVQVPVLVLRGDADTVIAPARQQDLAAKLPRRKDVVLSDQGHMIPYEDAVLCAREIRAFLDHDAARLSAGPLDARPELTRA